MNHPTCTAFLITASALVTSTLLAAGPIQQPDAPAHRSDEAAAGRFSRLCVDCHDAGRVTAMRRTSAEWEEVITNMVEKGATGSEAELTSVYEYLLANFGKTFINRAKAEEMVLVLGLSKKDADAIVTYRTANGPFADVDAVKKVTGIDVKAIDDHKDAIAF
ncbi:MAG: helix-hairpin-helix domain-containing protein [Vicinamibacterales bacterium]